MIFDKVQGIADLITIIATFFILFGLPGIHIVLLLKRATLNYGIEKKLPPKKIKSALEKAKEEEKKQEEEKKNQIDTYLKFLMNPFGSSTKVEEEEAKKKAEEKAKKKAE